MYRYIPCRFVILIVCASTLGCSGKDTSTRPTSAAPRAAEPTPPKSTASAPPVQNEVTRGEVSGTVRYKGQPVPAGTITLIGPDGSERKQDIAREGKYRIADLTPGEWKVAIETDSVLKGSDKSLFVKIPLKYATVAFSGLTATVVKGPNQRDFELTD